MISKSKIKLIRSLETKKGRGKLKLFVAEGPKIVDDLIHAKFELEELYEDIEDIKKISFLQHPQSKLGLFKLKINQELRINSDKELILALDGIQDPGNLGTIIRIADWFGIKHIICSEETADCWNPKVVQATMGSIARVQIHYQNLISFINSLPSDYPIYGTLLNGENIYNENLTNTGLIIMGNEGKGISPLIKDRVTKKLLIPNFSHQESKAESLNVAVATAIVCSEFRRNII